MGVLSTVIKGNYNAMAGIQNSKLFVDDLVLY